MAGYEDVIKRHGKPYLESLKDDIKARKDPEFFWPTGTQVYVGRQGSGKTISAVFHLRKLKERYPKAIVVSNLALDTNYLQPYTFSTKGELGSIVEAIDPSKEYILFKTMDELSLALTMVNNDKKGVIYIIDEIHTYFNSLESQNIPMYVFTEISQQRKQRKLIIGTSQLFLRMAKPFREQCDSLIVCTTHFGIFTTQKAYDGMTIEQDYDGTLSGNVKKTGFFFHNRRIRRAYDTFQKVVSGAEQYEVLEKPQKFEKQLKIR